MCVESLVGAFIARQEFNFELSLLDIICHPLNLYFHYRLQEIVETAQTLKTFKSSEFCIDSAIADGLLRNRYNHKVKSFRMITLTSFQLKWLERLLLYHFNDDSNLQVRFSAFQYGFRAEVSIETALHKFVRRIELSLAKKSTALGIFLDIVGAFDNITHSGIADALRELKVSPFLVL